LALFVQQLGRLLKASLPLDRALEILVGFTEDRLAKRLVQRLLDRVRDGASLAEAMAAQEGAFPPLCISMIRAGEEGAALRPVLGRMAEFLLRSEAMRQKVISALIYPAVLLVVASGSIGLVLTVVLPQFEPMLRDAGSKLPTIAWLVMLAGDGLREAWWMLLLAGLFSALVVRSLMRRPGMLLLRDRSLLHMPIVRSLVIRFEVGRFSRTLGVLLANGVPAARGLALAGATVGSVARANRTVSPSLDPADPDRRGNRSVGRDVAGNRRDL
jgi:general secretion pathway protein F